MPRSKRPTADAVCFGAIIRRLREERGWTLVKLADRCGMNPTYLGVLEKGKNIPSLGTILDLAEVFGIDGAEIVREVEQQRRARRKLTSS
jgi:transcriptional regulator with XRE-family HTH domain